jgi:hypothetical protein
MLRSLMGKPPLPLMPEPPYRRAGAVIYDDTYSSEDEGEHFFDNEDDEEYHQASIATKITLPMHKTGRSYRHKTVGVILEQPSSSVGDNFMTVRNQLSFSKAAMQFTCLKCNTTCEKQRDSSGILLGVKCGACSQRWSQDRLPYHWSRISLWKHALTTGQGQKGLPMGYAATQSSHIGHAKPKLGVSDISQNLPHRMHLTSHAILLDSWGGQQREDLSEEERVEISTILAQVVKAGYSEQESRIKEICETLEPQLAQIQLDRLETVRGI